jgi:dihydrofolate reductase
MGNMRNLVVTEFLSLDGVMETPMWTFPYWNDEIARFKGDETNASDALLLGRVTYEGFAAAWPESKDEGAPYMNSVRKYVVSTTLDKAEWNNSQIIRSNVVEEIKRLKQGDGKDLLVYGSGKLVQTLMQHDLVDHLRLLVYPLVLGKGQRLFEDGMNAKFNLVSTQSFSSGVVGLIYKPARES